MTLDQRQNVATEPARVEAAELPFSRPIDGVSAADHFDLLVDLEVGRNS
jgi:hypothetical protein